MTDQDAERFLEYSTSLLEWGGVKNNNLQKLESMGSDIISYFVNASERLNPIRVDTGDDFYRYYYEFRLCEAVFTYHR